MRLDDLLSQYDAARAAGTNPTPEELCRDTPELLEPLRYHVKALEAMKGLPKLPAEIVKPCVAATVTNTYTVNALHARGGLGEVYRARDERLNREVALKVIAGRFDGVRREHFEREAAITGKLEHPGIVPVHGVGQANDERPCYVMRFVAGQTLAEAVEDFHKGKAPLSRSNPQFRQLLTRIVQISQTIAFAHSRGVIHRDLKPGNIILGEFGETLAVDWGLATDTSEPGASATGEVTGTPAFMCPEQARGEAATPASDLFALGGLLYSVLTGAAPFANCSPPEMLAGTVPPPRSRRADVPVALEAVCRKAMAVEPGERYAEAREFAAEIERWLADESLLTARDSLPVRLRRWTRRHILLVASTAAGVVVAVVSLTIATALLSKSNAELRTAHALAESREQEALANFQLACDAVDRFTLKVSHDTRLRQQDLDKLRKELLEGAKLFYRDLTEKRRDDPTVRQQIFKAHLRLGLIASEQGDRVTAEAEYRQALAFAQDWPGERGRQQLLDEGDAWMGLSNVHHRAHRRAEALDAARRSLDLRLQAVGAEPENAFDRWGLATSYTHLAEMIAAIEGDVPAADAAYERSIQLSRRNYDENPNALSRWKELPTALNKRGVMKVKSKKYAEAEADWKAGRALVAVALTDTTDPDMRSLRHDLADLCINLANLYRITRRPAEAEELFAAGLKLYDVLVEHHPSQMDYRRGRTMCLSNLGALRFDAGQMADAEKLWRTCLEQRTAILAASPQTVEYRFDIMRVRCRLSDVAVSRKDAEAAREHLLAAEAALRPGKIDAKAKLTVASYWNDAAKLPALADFAWDRALILAEDLAREGSQAESLNALRILAESECFRVKARRDRLASPAFADPAFAALRAKIAEK